MIVGFSVCVRVCGGVIHLYSHCLSSLCVTDKADSTPSIWEDRITIQTAPCHYWHYICVCVHMWQRESDYGEGKVSVCYKRVIWYKCNCLIRPVLRWRYASNRVLVQLLLCTNVQRHEYIWGETVPKCGLLSAFVLFIISLPLLWQQAFQQVRLV